MSVSNLIKKLNQNKFFKFISSIRLAVPLMLILGICVSYGTIIESNYNSEYAAMAIYKSTWFGFLIIMLWINIFSSTISRIPFKQHHTGFVITHIGLLILLVGGYLTNSDGIDGQLVVPEKQSSSTVVLPHLMVAYQFEGSPTPQIVRFKKTIQQQNESDLKDINENTTSLFKVKQYIPFAKVEKTYVTSENTNDSAVALSFILKSNFFNVNEWLHSEKNPMMKMGPATLKIIKTADLNEIPNIGNKVNNKLNLKNTANKKTSKVILDNSKISEKSKNSRVIASENNSSEPVLVVSDSQNQKIIKKIKISELQKKSVSINGIEIKLVNYFQHAVVSQNKMIEGDDPAHINPALELSIQKKSEKIREVLYAKFAGFSLNQNGVFGFKFSFEDSQIQPVSSNAHGAASASTNSAASSSTNGAANSAADNTAPNAKSTTEVQSEEMNTSNNLMDKAQAAMKGDNTIVFSVDDKVPNKARITLIKNNQIVMTEILNEGQNIQTPWMGMQIFLGSVKSHAIEKIMAEPINPEKSQQLPPSALRISLPQQNEDFWLAEGEQKQVQIAQKSAVIYFGRQTIELPFDLKLEKFSKLDYPGTSTPMSYESLVQIGNTGINQKISMNEPLKMEGFTIYQASYSITPEQTLSIFSVNKDPGRALKYIGSLILGLGIITITLMRSRIWKNLLKRNAQHA